MKKAQHKSQKSSKSNLYRYCKKIFSIVLTLVILIPVVFILGSEQTEFSYSKLFDHASVALQYTTKVQEIITLAKTESIINVYYDEGENVEGLSEKIQWQNLREFSSYLGYHLNTKGNATISRMINPLQNKQSKNKNTQDKSSIQKSYQFSNFGEVNMLKNKLKLVLLKMIKKLKIKEQKTKESSLLSDIYIRSVKSVLKNHVWLLVVNPNVMSFYQSTLLIKQIKNTIKKYPSDKFIIFSQDQDKEIKNVKLSLSKEQIRHYQSKVLKALVRQYDIKIQYQPLQTAILCNYQDSLSYFHRFYQKFNSYSLIFKKMIEKKTLKKQISKKLKQICLSGQTRQDDQWSKYRQSLNLPVNVETQEIIYTISLFYEVIHGTKCKINKKCQSNEIKIQIHEQKDSGKSSKHKENKKEKKKDIPQSNKERSKIKPKSNIKNVELKKQEQKVIIQEIVIKQKKKISKVNDEKIQKAEDILETATDSHQTQQIIAIQQQTTKQIPSEAIQVNQEQPVEDITYIKQEEASDAKGQSQNQNDETKQNTQIQANQQHQIVDSKPILQIQSEQIENSQVQDPSSTKSQVKQQWNNPDTQQTQQKTEIVDKQQKNEGIQSIKETEDLQPQVQRQNNPSLDSNQNEAIHDNSQKISQNNGQQTKEQEDNIQDQQQITQSETTQDKPQVIAENL